ncbi:MAG: UDP-2,3-diacylglucosamine diphosphatase [Synergistaceae bacterium]|jgi:UDP-2,3-diacylglucosamine pyrophosphatase LpxH|nr:UDP-2,3-diacylglucosamine diphosphatase [Synergistaceae bacterium]
MEELEMARCRSIFLSDMHLGSPWCRAQNLLDFLSSHDCSELYLVGDTLDNWHLERGRVLPEKHLQVWEYLMRMARHTKMVYITGNHDRFLHKDSQYYFLFKNTFSHMELCQKTVHTAADGRRYLVTHGDVFDSTIKIPMVEKVTTFLYESLRSMGSRLPKAGRICRAEKLYLRIIRLQEMVTRIFGDPEKKMLKEIRSEGLDGIICGHTHLAKCKYINSLLIANCGHWLGTCHALVEKEDGVFSLLPWNDTRTDEAKVPKYQIAPLEATARLRTR